MDIALIAHFTSGLLSSLEVSGYAESDDRPVLEDLPISWCFSMVPRGACPNGSSLSRVYSSDFLLKCRDNLKETGELENWPGAQAIELQDVLVGVPNGRRLQTARSGPRVPPAMGRPPGADKWAQKGPLPGPGD